MHNPRQIVLMLCLQHQHTAFSDYATRSGSCRRSFMRATLPPPRSARSHPRSAERVPPRVLSPDWTFRTPFRTPPDTSDTFSDTSDTFSDTFSGHHRTQSDTRSDTIGHNRTQPCASLSRMSSSWSDTSDTDRTHRTPHQTYRTPAGRSGHRPRTGHIGHLAGHIGHLLSDNIVEPIQ